MIYREVWVLKSRQAPIGSGPGQPDRPLLCHLSDLEGTMEFVINGRNLAVSDRFREYAAEKVDKIEQLGDKVQRVDAKITKETSARDADTALTV